MVVAYLLLFLLLNLSASTCDATSRNHRLFLPSPPVIHDHRLAVVKDLSYDGDPATTTTTMMGRRGGPQPWAPPLAVASSGVEASPTPTLPGLEASGVGGGSPPPPEDASAAMSPPTPEQQVDDNTGGEGGTSSPEAGATEDHHEESSTDGVVGDYEGPKTHPPSHN